MRWWLILFGLAIFVLIPTAHAGVLATTAADWNSWNASTWGSGFAYGVGSTGGYDDSNGFAWVAAEYYASGWVQMSTTIDLSAYNIVYLYYWVDYYDYYDDAFPNSHSITLLVNGTEVASVGIETVGDINAISFNASNYGVSNVTIRYEDTSGNVDEPFVRIAYDYMIGSAYHMNVTVRDEQTGGVISNAIVRAVNSTTSLTNTTNSDGLTQFTLYRDKYITSATAAGYYNRTIIIDLVNEFGDYTMWLPNTSTDVVFCTFQLYDYTGLFPANSTKLIISKPINNSSHVVYSNYFDAFGRCAAYLVHNDNYQLAIESDVGMRTLGWFHPTDTREYTLPVGGLEVSGVVGLPVSYNITTERSGENITITVQYETKSGTTFYTNFTVYNESWDTVYSSSSNATSGSYTYTTSLAGLAGGWVKFYAKNSINDTYAVWWFGTHEAPTTPIAELPPWAKNVLSVGIVVFAVLMFTSRNLGAGLLIGSGLMGMFIAWGWLEVSELVAASLFVISALTVIARSRRHV